jgi:Arc/MetJ-type ribon-helix-helix transcriptional regulator
MMIYHTKGDPCMASAKIAITLETDLLERLDELVAERHFASRSRAVQDAVREKLARFDRRRFERECRKLDPDFEQKLAEQDFASGAELWPEY